MLIPAPRENLTNALARNDEDSRSERVERIEWLSQHYNPPGVMIGEMTVGLVLEEARHCFVAGHFISTVLLATCFIEHTLSEELENIGQKNERENFYSMIKAGRQHLSLPSDLFDRTDKLRLLRNPFAHRKAPNDPDAFGTRFLAAKAHPRTILEADAKLAIEVMFEWFQRTLRSA